MIAATVTIGGATTPGSVVAVEGDHVTVRGAAPAPPGSTLTFAATGLPGVFTLKVRGCRRDDQAFVVEGRLVSPSRSQREALHAASTRFTVRRDR